MDAEDKKLVLRELVACETGDPVKFAYMELCSQIKDLNEVAVRELWEHSRAGDIGAAPGTELAELARQVRQRRAIALAESRPELLDFEDGRMAANVQRSHMLMESLLDEASEVDVETPGDLAKKVSAARGIWDMQKDMYSIAGSGDKVERDPLAVAIAITVSGSTLEKGVTGTVIDVDE